MRAGPADAKVVAVEPVRLLLELEAGDPIRGSLHVEDGPPQEFAGLLELIAVLDQLRIDAVPDADEA
jgi:hypothetical protein